MTAAPASAQVRITFTPRSAATAAALLVATAAVLCGEAITESAVPSRAVVWGSLALAAYAAALLSLAGVLHGGKLGLGEWKFGPWILLWYGLTFGLATVTWHGPQTGTAAQIALSNVQRALWLVAAGMTFWAIGYFVGSGDLLRRLADRGVAVLHGHFTGTVRSELAPWILYAVGTAARVVSAATTGRFGYVGDVSSAVTTATGYAQVLSLISLFAPFGVAAAALQVYRERLPGARITLIVLFLAELAYGAAAGGKENFVIAVLAVVIPMSAARYRIPKFAVIGCTLVFLMIVIPFNQEYRNAARSGAATLSSSEALREAPSILWHTLTSRQAITALPESMDYLIQRVREIDSVAIVLQRTPSQIPFSSPVQLIEAPLADMVPRALWHGKPVLATGYQFSQQYYSVPANVYTSSAITPIGDLYRHGGWVPIIAGMLLLGCAVRLLDDVLDAHKNPHAIFLILLLLPSLVKGEQDWVTLMAGVPGFLLAWLVAVAVTFRHRRST